MTYLTLELWTYGSCSFSHKFSIIDKSIYYLLSITILKEQREFQCFLHFLFSTKRQRPRWNVFVWFFISLVLVGFLWHLIILFSRKKKKLIRMNNLYYYICGTCLIVCWLLLLSREKNYIIQKCEQDLNPRS